MTTYVTISEASAGAQRILEDISEDFPKPYRLSFSGFRGDQMTIDIYGVVEAVGSDGRIAGREVVVILGYDSWINEGPQKFMDHVEAIIRDAAGKLRSRLANANPNQSNVGQEA